MTKDEFERLPTLTETHCVNGTMYAVWRDNRVSLISIGGNGVDEAVSAEWAREAVRYSVGVQRRLVSLPKPAAPALAIGTVIQTREQLEEAVRVGAVLENGKGRRWTPKALCVADDTLDFAWPDEGGRVRTGHGITDCVRHGHRVAALPGAEPQAKREEAPEGKALPPGAIVAVQSWLCCDDDHDGGDIKAGEPVYHHGGGNYRCITCGPEAGVPLRQKDGSVFHATAPEPARTPRPIPPVALDGNDSVSGYQECESCGADILAGTRLWYAQVRGVGESFRCVKCGPHPSTRPIPPVPVWGIPARTERKVRECEHGKPLVQSCVRCEYDRRYNATATNRMAMHETDFTESDAVTEARAVAQLAVLRVEREKAEYAARADARWREKMLAHGFVIVEDDEVSR